jgi:hypothetical protein
METQEIIEAVATVIEIKYYTEARSNGRVAVVRRGPKGGTRVVNVYTHRDIATRIADRLQLASNQEA